ncbi:MAG TPA: NAD(P)/FAD-dependent oxidoreductase, partial [Clostridia bacterium]|nr:NAD(P)/FAD-dependent oxidoreductase [Clostridia bacterium]
WNLSLELENLFPEEEQNILSFLQEIEKINAEKTSLVFSKPAYLLSPLERAALEMKTRLTKPKLYKYRFKTASDVLGSFFKEERLKTIFHTVVPWERASFLQLAQRWTAFLKRGLYYPKGGYQALANCFVDGFLNQGGQLILNSQVAKILLQGEKAVGVELTDGTKISTDKVVAGCDLRETLEVLVGKEHFPEEYFNSLAVKKLSSSAFYVYLGVSIPEDRIPFSRAVLCSVNNIEQFSGHLEDGETCPVFIDIPNKYDPDMAAGGNSIIILSVPASVSDLNNWGINGTGLSGKKYNVLKAEIADKLIERCEKLIPGLKERIVVKTVATPYTFQSCTSNQNGAAFGWAELPGELERPGQVSPIKNLYFVGHWTYPGGGIPSVVESGMVLANLIANEKI